MTPTFIDVCAWRYSVFSYERSLARPQMADLLLEWMNADLSLSQPVYSLEAVRRPASTNVLDVT